MARCEMCGNDYDKSFELIAAGSRHVFDSFECAIRAVALFCEHCGCKMIGRGTEVSRKFFCCTHCARTRTPTDVKDRAVYQSVPHHKTSTNLNRTQRRMRVRRGNVGTPWVQVNREGNSLINELIIGTGSKDKFSTDDPKNDSQFAGFFLDPLLAHLFNSVLDIPVPPPPRLDLLPLVQYMAPICPGCGPNDAGPIADLLRLNTGIPPTPVANQKRLGFLAGDTAGFPNGRRPVGPGQAGCSGRPGGICPIN